jgi:hypothetical protein
MQIEFTVYRKYHVIMYSRAWTLKWMLHHTIGSHRHHSSGEVIFPTSCVYFPWSLDDDWSTDNFIDLTVLKSDRLDIPLQYSRVNIKDA